MIKQSHQTFAETLLFVLNTLLVFLLIFGNHLVIPQWLQPVGRMHPLLLHFPIVILMMGILFEFFRFRSAFREEVLYQNFTTALLLLGSLLAAITAIMGLFLSKEAGYSGNVLQWHKWTGVSLVWLSSAIYWCRNLSWYKTPIAKTAAITAFICLVFAGHYGADITHGENFVLGPVMHQPAAVPIDKALVYQDVIQPIFDTKCVSCHNDDKLKGRLMLTDMDAILKGGKSGKLFIGGSPQLSLLLQRLHLPLADDKHMPPAGKPQLTDDEIALLYLWIKGKPNFTQKVIALSVNDSLRLLAASRLSPPTTTTETYDFSAADEKTIKSLNNNYRVVQQIAQESPALTVSIYSKSNYTPKAIEELESIKKQIVSLSLNKLPVKDAELKTIAQFTNLRRLNLNFTDISGRQLSELANFKNLKELSLAGIKLKVQEIEPLLSIKSLAELVIWNTGIKDTELQQIKQRHKQVNFVTGFKDDGIPIKLNNPQIKSTTWVFSKPFELVISHPIKGVIIRYTTDGSDPDSIKSPVYKPGMIISSDVTIKTRAYKAGWYGSDIVTLNYNRNTYTPDTSIIDKNNGGKMMIDKELGSFKPFDGKWVGVPFEMVINITFIKPVSLKTIGMGCLRLNGQQILFPAGIEILGGTDKRKLNLVGRIKPAKPLKDDPDKRSLFEAKLTTAEPLKYFQIRVKPVKPQSWFPPQKTASVWVDELFFN
jgi:uncharacterized membrane protein